MKKYLAIIIGFIIFLVLIEAVYITVTKNEPSNKVTKGIVDFMFGKPFTVEKVELNSDKDLDGIKDLDDIVQGARLDIKRKPKYKSVYYQGGYPPDTEGVCSDVIWRALKNAGFNLKDMVDKDIKDNTGDYPDVEGKPDPNIDFRRVKNLFVFFNKYADCLDTKILPYDKKNLITWQGGDIVIFENPDHIGIVSDKRGRDGVPFVIHNGWSHTKESNILLSNKNKIVGHFRFPKL